MYFIIHDKFTVMTKNNFHLMWQYHFYIDRDNAFAIVTIIDILLCVLASSVQVYSADMSRKCRYVNDYLV